MPTLSAPEPQINSAPFRDQAGSPERFGYEWATYSKILDESRVQIERWLGSTGLASFAGKRVLDVGCGMGRNPHWYLTAGAKSVLAVDVDEQSLGAARTNLRQHPNARVDKCSAYELEPGVQGTFDRVTCIGVLHHLSDPPEALRRMWAMVAPGGDLVLWCYGKEGNRLFLSLIETLRFVGSRAPIGVTHGIAKAVSAAAWPVLKTVPWRTEYYRNVASLSFRNVESIVFDQILPRIANYWTEAEMRRLIKPLAGTGHLEFVQGNSWHARIQRPAPR